MDNDKGKAVWDEYATQVFINACVEQIHKKERRGSTFTPKGWKVITSKFNEKTGKEYGKKQFRNRLDVLKKELKCWDALNKETGVSRDPVTNAISASNEWWNQKIQVNSNYRKFRCAGLQNENKLRLIFKDVAATGKQCFAPSYTQPQSQEEDQKDVDRHTMDEEEGSRDSEDELIGTNPAISTGVTDDIASIGLTNITPPTVPSESGSQGKRKRAEGQVKNKRHKIPASKQIANAVSVMANAYKDRAESLKEIRDASVDVVMSDLLSLDEIKDNLDFRVRCMKLLQDKTCRETFASVRSQHAYLIQWLRFMVYGTTTES